MAKSSKKTPSRTEPNLTVLAPALLTRDMLVNTVITTEYVSATRAIGLMWSLMVDDNLHQGLSGECAISVAFRRRSETDEVYLQVSLDNYVGEGSHCLVRYTYPISSMRDMMAISHLVKTKIARGYFKGNNNRCNYSLKYIDPDYAGITTVTSVFIDRADDYRVWFNKTSEYAYVDQYSLTYPPLRIASIVFAKSPDARKNILAGIRNAITGFISGVRQEDDMKGEGVLLHDKRVWYMD